MHDVFAPLALWFCNESRNCCVDKSDGSFQSWFLCQSYRQSRNLQTSHFCTPACLNIIEEEEITPRYPHTERATDEKSLCSLSCSLSFLCTRQGDESSIFSLLLCTLTESRTHTRTDCLESAVCHCSIISFSVFLCY